VVFSQPEPSCFIDDEKKRVVMNKTRVTL